MNRETITEKLNEIFADIFDNKDICISNETTSSDIDGWDSLTHLTLISQVEKSFGIRFRMKDVIGMKNVGEMIDIIEKNT